MECTVEYSFSAKARNAKAKLVEAIDPYGKPLETLLRLACKLTFLAYKGDRSIYRTVRNLLYTFYSIYSAGLEIAITELPRPHNLIIIHNPECEYNYNVEASPEIYNLSVKSCSLEYKCTCRDPY